MIVRWYFKYKKIHIMNYTNNEIFAKKSNIKNIPFYQVRIKF